MEYVTDEQGKWLIQGSARLLIEPSESYLAEREIEEQQRQEEEANRPPTKEELLEQEVISLRTMLESLVGGVE